MDTCRDINATGCVWEVSLGEALIFGELLGGGNLSFKHNLNGWLHERNVLDVAGS